MIRYTLPDGRIVRIPYELCHAHSAVSFTLTTGVIVLAVICTGER